MQKEYAEYTAQRTLADFIRTKKLRQTRERTTVLKTIYHMRDKVSIEEIIDEHKRLFPKVHLCRSTAYNCIRILLEANVIHELKEDNSTVYCKVFGSERIIELTCTQCRKTERIAMHHLGLVMENPGVTDFQILNYRVILHGICARCKMSMEKKH